MDCIKYKFFTLEEANSILPEVRLLLDQVKLRKEDLVKSIIQLKEMQGKSRLNGNRKRFVDAIKNIVQSNKQLNGAHQEMLAKGLVVRDYETGSIDFPTIIEGDLGYFRWNPDDEEVSRWHGADEPVLKLLTEDINILHSPMENGDMSEN